MTDGKKEVFKKSFCTELEKFGMSYEDALPYLNSIYENGTGVKAAAIRKVASYEMNKIADGDVGGIFGGIGNLIGGALGAAGNIGGKVIEHGGDLIEEAFRTGTDLLAKGVPISIATGASVGLAKSLIQRQQERKKYLEQQVIDKRLNKMRKKIMEMEGAGFDEY